MRNTKRTSLLVKNVIASFAIKGWSALVALIMVPLTLECLGEYNNGVWLTISSLLVWIDQMDIGLGNGLRNKLTEYTSLHRYEEARQVVSSTMVMLAVIILPIWMVLELIVLNTDVYALLNVKPGLIPELRVSLVCAVTLVCSTFVLKFISNVYMGLQMPAVSNLLISLGQTLALLCTIILYHLGKATFPAIVIVNTAAPLAIYMLSYPYTFNIRFPELRPSLRLTNLHFVLEVGNLGIRFFWIQIAGLLQFATANILISHLFSPQMVTPYQISHRYTNLIIVIFSVICMPFWNATTDAYTRGDMEWIKNADRKMTLMMTGIAVLLVVMVMLSPWVYSVWIGKGSHIPFGMTVMMSIYTFLMALSMRYAYFLNGIGALRLQMYMTAMTVIFIPSAWYISHLTHNILWFMAVMCFCITPSIIVNMIQFKKILNGRAKGLWRI